MGRKKGKTQLTREMILTQAISLADKNGIEVLTIRRLARELESAPMSIYHYFSSRDEIIDAMVESVFAEIALPPEDKEWKEAIRIRCHSAREVMKRHFWSPFLMESRRIPGPNNLRHHNALLRCLRKGGLSLEQTSIAVALLDSLVFGFTLQEISLPGGGGQEMIDLGRQIADTSFNDLPYLMEMFNFVESSDYDFASFFDIGLDLLLKTWDNQ